MSLFERLFGRRLFGSKDRVIYVDKLPVATKPEITKPEITKCVCCDEEATVGMYCVNHFIIL